MLDGRQFPTGESQGNDPESGALFGFQWNIIGRHLVPHLVLAWPQFLRRGSGHLLLGFQWVPSTSALPVTSCQSVFRSGGQKKNGGLQDACWERLIKMILKCSLGPTAPQVTGHETKKNFKTNFAVGGRKSKQKGTRKTTGNWQCGVPGNRQVEKGWETKWIRDNSQQIHGTIGTLTNKQLYASEKQLSHVKLASLSFKNQNAQYCKEVKNTYSWMLDKEYMATAVWEGNWPSYQGPWTLSQILYLNLWVYAKEIIA